MLFGVQKVHLGSGLFCGSTHWLLAEAACDLLMSCLSVTTHIVAAGLSPTVRVFVLRHTFLIYSFLIKLIIINCLALNNRCGVLGFRVLSLGFRVLGLGFRV